MENLKIKNGGRKLQSVNSHFVFPFFWHLNGNHENKFDNFDENKYFGRHGPKHPTISGRTAYVCLNNCYTYICKICTRWCFTSSSWSDLSRVSPVYRLVNRLVVLISGLNETAICFDSFFTARQRSSWRLQAKDPAAWGHQAAWPNTNSYE